MLTLFSVLQLGIYHDFLSENDAPMFGVTVKLTEISPHLNQVILIILFGYVIILYHTMGVAWKDSISARLDRAKDRERRYGKVDRATDIADEYLQSLYNRSKFIEYPLFLIETIIRIGFPLVPAFIALYALIV